MPFRSGSIGAEAETLRTNGDKTPALQIVPFDEPSVVGVRRLDAFIPAAVITASDVAAFAPWQTQNTGRPEHVRADQNTSGLDL